MDDGTLGAGVRRHSHPIADRGVVGGGSGQVSEATADLRPAVEVSGQSAQAALLLDHTRHPQRRELWGDLRSKEVAPAKTLEGSHDYFTMVSIVPAETA